MELPQPELTILHRDWRRAERPATLCEERLFAKLPSPELQKFLDGNDAMQLVFPEEA